MGKKKKAETGRLCRGKGAIIKKGAEEKKDSQKEPGRRLLRWVGNC